ncbi:MAG: hypothetical protein H6742_04455 [Alphaproteobacteria bacterium]|nr:hypothetical protein [Alphaproteobacteria bacterium]
MRALALGVLFAAGCSGMADKAGADDSQDVDPGGGDTADGGGDVDSGESPEWWRLEADLWVEDGVPVLDETVLRLSVLLGTDCVDELAADSVVVLDDLPHETVYTWWELALPADGWSCLAAGEGPRPGPIRLGVGAMHPEVLAVLGSMADVEGDASSSLNGAYLQLPDSDELLVFGAAGPEAAWAGEGTAVVDGTLETGSWWVRTAYSFPMAGASSPTAATSPDSGQ